jgi:hypothetical protein
MDVMSVASWQAIAPSLALGRQRAESERNVPLAQRASIHQRLAEDGLFTAPSGIAPAILERLRRGIDEIRAARHHEVFALLFDEPWVALASIAGQLRAVLGADARVVPTPYVNYVVPGDAGFSPHRDRYEQPLAGDGRPNVVTAWLSLTKADPQRACLGFLPTRFDPGFPDALERLRIPDLRDVRSVPVDAGTLVCFNQSTLHWGHRNVADAPRVSIAFELERAGIAGARSPSLALGEVPSFEARLGFVGTSIGRLAQNRCSFDAGDLALALRMSTAIHGDRFAGYWQPPARAISEARP